MNIELAEYDDAWPGLYERERARILAVLPDADLEHVGSTSVPGLCAKPVIDMMLVVEDAADEEYVPALEAAGYRVTVREDDWHDHRILKGPDTNVNLHVFSRGCAQVRRHLVFRDWLRADSGDRELYARAKRELAAREWERVQDYAAAKGEVVLEILERAYMTWRPSSGEVEYVTKTPPHDAPVVLEDYNPVWPRWYAVEEARIRAALGDVVVRLEHVGSTSIPGLAAKPLIDVLLVVPDSADEDAYVPALVEAGYWLLLRERGWHEHRLLKRSEPNVNLHVISPACEEWDRMVGFRDRLRTHPEDRAEYERTKRALAGRTWHRVQDYAEAKAAVVERIILRALA
ncbi:GrpB family protein [Lentzea sp. BCCO 10_0856]|uniref:GrpB family protein n=1 Tax=Lentzea miocenica TaxID=3095431 RepID=A0ABU4SX77_9PSEU|nr:GrpB family protein [Lentzea sp. BCCO 10_0856]MDX8030445.1 GrpB family protein [Lentzea sp. BCCO 10_0856]